MWSSPRFVLPALAASALWVSACTNDPVGATATDGETEDSGASSTTAPSGTNVTTSDPSSTGTEGTGSETTSGPGSETSSGVADSSSSGASESSSSTGSAIACEDATVLGEDFTYLWVANSPFGTISKINTETLVEEARYMSRPSTDGSPSRTSVNLNGDVAVANRNGGITMFRARMEDCVDPNNTSSGADDVRAWPDGCVGWYTPFLYSTQRPVAWTEGEFSEETCRYENTRLWTAGAVSSSSEIEILLLDGDTGMVEATIPTDVPADTFGLYGGAVDADGNFWGSKLSGQVLFRVSLDDLSLTQWEAPSGYGITVDGQGRPWTCQNQLARFNPATESWDVSELGFAGGGCAVDANEVLWVAGSSNRLLGVDVDTFEIVRDFPIPGYAKGVSVDFEGNIWAVSLGADAWRVDPDDGTYETVSGFEQPYTYSDMTGFSLALQASR